MKAYQESIETVIKEFKTNIDSGLSTDEVKRRLQEYGPNSFPEAKPDSLFILIINQFKSPLIYVLFVAALITIILQEWFDTIIIFAVVIFNAIIGSIQEGKTQKIITSLAKLLKTESIVIRNGQEEVIPDQELVPGDIILLQEGMRVPADVRLFQAHALNVDEAVLTGESKPVHKTYHQLSKELRIYEQHNIAFQGTYIMSGNGKAIVIATGNNTEIGKLHKIIQSISTEFPLKKEMERLARWIIITILTLTIILFAVGSFLHINFYTLLVTLTALFVSAIPEGLPVIGTLVLVRGAYAMAKKQFLIKKLQAVEALGRTNIILTDKTGTITRNEMMVTTAYIHNKWYTITGEGYKPDGEILFEEKPIDEHDKKLLQKIASSTLMSTTQLYYDPEQKQYLVKGNQTEAAMIVFAQKLGLNRDKMLKNFSLLYEQPFDKTKRYNFGCFSHKDAMICYMTGSPETIMRHAKNDNKPDHDALAKMLAQGLRVIGIATLEYELKEMPQHKKDIPQFVQDHFDYIKFVGLFGMQDAIRPDVKNSVQQAHTLGVKVALVTGDHKKTAELVAQEVDIFQKGDLSTTGEDFLALSQKERQKAAPHITVYARFVPKEKYDLVLTYHELGQIVALTGDGVNDAPSLAAADIGIAMGIMGTEVAKEAADAILLNDSFSSIVDGIYEGRNVFYSLRRIILYFFATNLSEILVIMISLFAQLPLPLLAVQILWMNIVTDGFLDIGLIFEPQDKKLIRNQKIFHQKLIDKSLILKIIIMMIPMVTGSIWIFHHSLPQGIEYARTMALTTLIIFQWLNAWNCRSEWTSTFRLRFNANKPLLLMIAIVITLQILVTYTPLRYAFRITPLSWYDWTLCIAASSSILLIDELRKFLIKITNSQL